jgi:TonB family protein
MKTIISTALFLAACNVASSPGLEPTTGASSPVPALAIKQLGDTAAFPALASEARLPTADHMRVPLLAEGHEQLTSMVRVCVKSDGSTADVKLTHSSGVPSLDRAILRDVATWKYEPAAAYTCAPFELTYAP